MEEPRLDCSYCSMPVDVLFNSVKRCKMCGQYMCEECIVDDWLCPECFVAMGDEDD